MVSAKGRDEGGGEKRTEQRMLRSISSSPVALDGCLFDSVASYLVGAVVKNNEEQFNDIAFGPFA